MSSSWINKTPGLSIYFIDTSNTQVCALLHKNSPLYLRLWNWIFVIVKKINFFTKITKIEYSLDSFGVKRNTKLNEIDLIKMNKHTHTSTHNNNKSIFRLCTTNPMYSSSSSSNNNNKTDCCQLTLYWSCRFIWYSQHSCTQIHTWRLGPWQLWTFKQLHTDVQVYCKSYGIVLPSFCFRNSVDFPIILSMKLFLIQSYSDFWAIFHEFLILKTVILLNGNKSLKAQFRKNFEILNIPPSTMSPTMSQFTAVFPIRIICYASKKRNPYNGTNLHVILIFQTWRPFFTRYWEFKLHIHLLRT